MASTQPAPVDVNHDEQEEFIDQSDIAAEVGDDAEEDHPMDEDDEQEPGGDGQEEIVWEDNSIAQFTAHSSSSSDESKSVFAVAAHPTQPLAVSGGEDDMGYIWDLDSGEQIVKLTGHTDSVAAVGFSHDGELVATGGMDGHVRLWRHVAKSGNWKTWEFLTDVQGPDEVWLRWHPSRNVLAAGSTDSTVWIWNFPSGTPLLVLSAHESPLTAGLFTPNGKRLLSASDSGTLIFTDPRTPTPVFKLTSSDARFGMEAGITAIGVNAASTVAVVGGTDGQVRVVNLTKGDVVGALESHAEGESVETIAFVSPAATATGTTDLELVVTGATDGKIFISDLNTRRLRTTLLGHEDAITSLTVHSDGRLITSSSSDKTLRTWDVRTGECIRIHKGHAGPVMGAAVGKRSTGEEVVVSAGDEGVCLVFPTR
ncbi:WD repeat-containing protein [Ceratobasidium sp. AG-Ba]|nr:WD repeat-containing protein [Ceratobasidium sp. AG-Ba]